MKGYPRWINATSVTAFVLALAGSGLLLAPTTLSQKLDWEVTWRLSDAARLWVAATHLVVSLAFVWLLGALWSIHMRAGWKKKQGRKSGGTLVGLAALLAGTAVLIYYSGNEELSRGSSVSHLVTGVLLLLIYFGHLFKEKRDASKRTGRASRRPAGRHPA